MTKKSLIKRLPTLLINLAIVLFAVWLILTPNESVRNFLQRIDYLIYDIRLNATLKPKAPQDLPVVIVDIDEKSLGEQGHWPWPRNKIAELVNKLRAAGATVIAFDIIFSEAERNISNAIIESLQHQPQSNPNLVQSLQQLSPHFDNDQQLASAIRKGQDVILGIIFHNDPEYSRGTLPKPLTKIENTDPSKLLMLQFPGYLTNINVIQNSSDYSGFLNTVPDIDGVVRRVPLLIRYHNKIYPSLALQASRNYLLIDDIKVNSVAQADQLAIEGVSLGDQFIPTDAKGQVIIPYVGKRASFKYYSATDVLNGKLKSNELENKLVFIGTSATGLFDLHTAPMESVYPGVEVHANIANAIINNHFPYQPDWSKGAEIISTCIIGLLLTLIFPFLGPLALTLTSCLTIASIITFETWLWIKQSIVLSFTVPTIMVILQALFNAGYGFLFETRKSRVLSKAFSQYVPPAHVRRISENPNLYSFEGESRELTVLFADIRNFTTISETLDAGKLKQLLNRYFTPMTEIIFNRAGTIDKYVGDMIMAFWGAPVEDPKHREHALDAALDIVAKSDSLQTEFREINLPTFTVGVGINTGIMNVGDMGSEFRRSYTVLGDAVNLGSRIEGTTKYYGVKIAVGEASCENQSEFLFRKLDRVRVKGKHKAIEVFELISRREHASVELLEEIKLHERGMVLYFAQQWHAALEIFEALQKTNQNKKIYSLLIERIHYFQQNPPGGNWDGSFERTEK